MRSKLSRYKGLTESQVNRERGIQFNAIWSLLKARNVGKRKVDLF